MSMEKDPAKLNIRKTIIGCKIDIYQMVMIA